MSLSKPYYRIARPFIDGDYAQNIANFYATDTAYAADRRQLIRAYELLAEGLIRIFDYIEPTDDNLSTYSHRTYELILRASTEFETNCKAILNANGYLKSSGDLNIVDYFKINKATRADEYEIRLNIWSPEPKILKPFESWKAGHTLPWYKSYNAVKHDRNKNFPEASLDATLNAIAAVFAILFTQFHFLSFQSWHNTGMYENGEDGFNSYPQSLFAIKVPESWPMNEQYDFDWNTLKSTPSPIEKYAFL